ncbi:hypothetical protein [Rheinheimera sp. SA_1]|uniref:hypothetical protein n=1 Tax=Rheinheimera sp. SA_1 TaxID=1827365 RepID=UPI0018D424A2|nr:hypothetical protein [Rheinheimera sp. SA_1]
MNVFSLKSLRLCDCSVMLKDIAVCSLSATGTTENHVNDVAALYTRRPGIAAERLLLEFKGCEG